MAPAAISILILGAGMAVVFLWRISNALERIAFQLRRLAHAAEKKPGEPKE